ncbi:MarR family winged helix-turn-helix transcriptional regulator [Actinomadura kijaniata]|uniref:MarR family winged helix-turn-helix transcriptional regulator n=1 Tax=Actinomadura kijaniata TaxID=46161 RepID=UPI003F193B7C
MTQRPSGERHEIFRDYLDAVGLHALAGAEAAGLQASEWYAMSQISLAGGLTPGELSARTGLTTGATTRLIDRLERAGRVRRVADPGDRRRVVVEPAPDAPDVDIDAIVGPARRRVGEVLERYTPEQREVLFDYFRRAAPAFREATEEIRAALRDRKRR